MNLQIEPAFCSLYHGMEYLIRVQHEPIMPQINFLKNDQDFSFKKSP